MACPWPRPWSTCRRASSPCWAAPSIRNHRLGPEEGVIAEAARTRQPVEVGDLTREARSEIEDIILSAGYRALLIVPSFVMPLFNKLDLRIKPGEKVSQRAQESRQDFTTRIEKAAVFRSLENLMTFPFVRNKVEKGEMELHGAYFGVAEGSLFVLDPEAKEFRSVREDQGSL